MGDTPPPSDTEENYKLSPEEKAIQNFAEEVAKLGQDEESE